MKIAIYDTHIAKKNGETMHFDIMVPDGIPHEKVLEFGKEYLKKSGQDGQSISADECEYCHSGHANQVVQKSISTQGFYIYEMEGCH